MTARELIPDKSYKGCIYSAADVFNWKKINEFIVPGLPTSFEIMNDEFYIGLGGRYDRMMGWDFLIGPESGSIWKIEPVP